MTEIETADEVEITVQDLLKELTRYSQIINVTTIKQVKNGCIILYNDPSGTTGHPILWYIDRAKRAIQVLEMLQNYE